MEMGDRLHQNARIVLEASCLAKEKESIVILTDREEFRYACARALEQAALELGAVPVILDITAFRRSSALALGPIRAALESADIAVLLWSSWSSSGYGRLVGDPDAADTALSAKRRWLELTTPGMDQWDITKEDVLAVRRRTQRLAARLAKAKSIRMTTPAGTDFSCFLDTDTNRMQILGYIPLYAEVATIPPEGSGEGVYVVDGGAETGGEPTRFSVKAGHVESIQGNPERVAYYQTRISRSDPPVANIDEVSVVTTHLAASDAFWGSGHHHGTVHIALGNNRDRRTQLHGSLHIDGHLLSPTVRVDGQVVMENGVFLDALVK
jgi:hypothetical protein